jgi:ABC-type Zn uptake system ZnuABC Zn-binding protein ZnuA
LLVLASLHGCDKPSPAPTRAPDTFSIVATAYPLADIARQVVGPLATYDWIVEQGQSLDGIDPTSQALDKIHGADFVLTSGAGEEWAVAGFDDPRRTNSIVRLDMLDSGKADAGCRQLWLDPQVAREFAKELAERVTVRRPSQEKTLRANAEKFSREIDSLMRELEAKRSAIRGKRVLILSADYSAMTRAFGLVEIHPFDANPMRLSDEQIRSLRETIAQQSPGAMLVEMNLPPAAQQDLSQQLGIPLIAIDSYGSSSGTGRNTYQAIERFDLEQLGQLNH